MACKIKRNVIWKVNNKYIYCACFGDNEALFFGKYNVLNTKYCACYSDCKDKDCFLDVFF